MSTFWKRLKWLFKGGSIPEADEVFPAKHITIHTSYHDTVPLMATYCVDWNYPWESSDEAQKIVIHHLKEEIYKQVAPFIEIETIQDVPNMSVVYRARLRVVNSEGY